MADFKVIMEALLSHDNETRNNAEEQFSSLDVSLKFSHLISTLRMEGSSEEVKTVAAVLLRRVFLQLEYKDLIDGIDPTLLQSGRAELLMAVQQEGTSVAVRRKICDAVAELARSFIDDNDTNHWPEVLRFLFDCSSPEQPQLYECALHIISTVPGIFGNQMDYWIELIRQLLSQALQNPHREVWTEAFKASTAYISFLDNTTIQQQFGELLPFLLTVLERSLELQEDDSLLKAMIELAERCPKLLRSQLDNIVELMLKVMGTTGVEDSWKQLSLEVIVTLAENAPAMMRKHTTKFLPKIVTQCLQFMLEVEDEPEWLVADDTSDDEDNSSNAIAGETSLDRLANSLSGKSLLPHIISNIPQMLQSADWHYRHAALMAISAIGEGCERQMSPILADVVGAVLPYCQDSHHRVRYAACNALGQMSNDFAPTIQKKFHDKIIPALLLVMEDFATPRVQTHGGAALVNFCEQCPKSILVTYLPAIVAKLDSVFKVRLQELLQKGTKLVLEQVVTTTATVADVVEEQFVEYYHLFMPSLKYIMANAGGKDYRLLRGKTIECISLIGLAVGPEKFMQDAQEVMQLLLSVQTLSQQGEMASDDPQISYMISAWARMCKIIGPGFVEYLPVVMGPLLQAAGIKPEIAIVDSPENQQNFSEDEGWEFITLADQQRFGIKTAGLDDKCTAMQMLVVYAKDLKNGFAEYAEPVAKIMVPHLRFYFHELVRAAAAEILPHLLECIKCKGTEAVKTLWGFIADKLLEAIELEPDAEIRAIMMDSLCKCIEFLGLNCFTAEQYSKVANLLKDSLEMCFTRAGERHVQRQDEDYDEQVEEELEEADEEDEETLKKVADVMHSLFLTHGSTLLPFFDQLLPIFTSMLADDRPPSHKQWALCVFDDLLEHASSSCHKYQSYFLDQMIKCVTSKHASVRQAAAYGIGVMAQFCSKDFSQACLDALPLLTLSIQAPDAKQDLHNINATENAVSAVSKICKFVDTGVTLDTVLPLWFSWLPITEDKEEAPHVYSYLCDLIESNNLLILGPDNSNLPRIVSIIAEVCVEDALMDGEQVLLRLLSIARHVQATGDSVWNACLQRLNEKQRTCLLTALS